MRMNPHLSFNGQCKAAFEFYEKNLGGTITFMVTYGDSALAQHTPAGWHEMIIHATLQLGDQMLTAADAPEEHYNKPQGFSLVLTLDSAEEADRLFRALAEDGTVQLELQETFWTKRFGMCTDRFGIPWMVSCANPM